MNKIINGENVSFSDESDNEDDKDVHEETYVPMLGNYSILKRNASENDLDYDNTDNILIKKPSTICKSLTSSVDWEWSKSRNSICEIMKMHHTFFELGEESEWKTCISVDAWGRIRKLSNVESTNVDESLDLKDGGYT